MKTAVIGIGSPVLSDGAVPLRVVEELRGRGRCGTHTEFTTLPAGGFDLLAVFEGCTNAVIITVYPHRSGSGTMIIEKKVTGATGTAAAEAALLPGDHGVEVAQILALGRQCGYTVPDEVVVVGITGAIVFTVGENRSGAVTGMVNGVIRRVEELVSQWDT